MTRSITFSGVSGVHTAHERLRHNVPGSESLGTGTVDISLEPLQAPALKPPPPLRQHALPAMASADSAIPHHHSSGGSPSANAAAETSAPLHRSSSIGLGLNASHQGGGEGSLPSHHGMSLQGPFATPPAGPPPSLASGARFDALFLHYFNCLLNDCIGELHAGESARRSFGRHHTSSF